MLSIGLMSGTSMDGIDAALLETDGTPQLVRELGHVSICYDAQTKILLKAAEYALRKYAGDRAQAELNFQQVLQEYVQDELKAKEPFETAQSELPGARRVVGFGLDQIIHHSTELHLQAVQKLLAHTGYSAAQINVVGYHGQALYHNPAAKISVIVGNGQYMADQLGIRVVNDFRSRDIANGGQGAPFAPLYHQALAIRDNKIPVAVVNCGGIANITLINNNNELDLIGFDTGPGNGLIDRLVRQRTQGKEHMDADAKYGKQGKVVDSVLQLLTAKAIIKNGQNYLKMPAPKSLDIGDLQLIPELDALSLEDACATLEAFTADTIVNSLDLVKVAIPNYWILAGGGWNNPVILAELKTRLRAKYGAQLQILTADQAGWNNQALEAQIFAYLAVRSLQNMPLSVPGTTRVAMPVSGGQLYEPRSA